MIDTRPRLSSAHTMQSLCCLAALTTVIIHAAVAMIGVVAAAVMPITKNVQAVAAIGTMMGAAVIGMVMTAAAAVAGAMIEMIALTTMVERDAGQMTTDEIIAEVVRERQRVARKN